MQRVENRKRIELGNREVAEYTAEPQRFEVEQTFDVDLEIVADGVVEIKLDAEACDEHVHYRLQGFVADVAESVRNCGHIQQRIDDFGKRHGMAHIIAVVILHERPVGELSVSVRIRVRVGIVDFLISRVGTVTHGEVQTETRHAARRVALEIALRYGFVDNAAYVIALGVGDVRLIYRNTHACIVGVDVNAHGRRLEIDVDGHFRAEIERFEDGIDVHIRARERSDYAENDALGDVEGKMPFRNFEHDVEHIFFVRLRRGIRRGHRFGRTFRTVIFDAGKQSAHHFDDGGDDARIFDDKVFVGQFAHIDVHRGAFEIDRKDDVGGNRVFDLEGNLCVFGVAEHYVGAEIDVHGKPEVVGYFDAEFKGKIGYYRGEHISERQFPVFERRGVAEGKFETDGGFERNDAVLREDVLVIVVDSAVSFGNGRFDGVAVVVDCHFKPAESERNGEGVYAEGEVYAYLSAAAFAEPVEQGQEAVLGIELHEIVRVQLISGQQHIEQRHEEVRAEADFQFAVRHINAVDDAENGVEDIVGAVRRIRFAVRGGESLVLRSFAFRGSVGVRRKERAEVDVGHGNAAADETARIGSDVKRALAHGLISDDVNREQIFRLATLPDFERNIGVGKDIAHIRHIVAEAQQRLQGEFERRRNASVYRKRKHQFLDERLHVVGDCGITFEEVVYPIADIPVAGGVGVRRKVERSAELDIYAVEFQPLCTELIVFVKQTADVLIICGIEACGQNRLAENALSYSESEPGEGNVHRRHIAHFDFARKEIAAVLVLDDVRPVERKHCADFPEVHTDEVVDDGGKSLRDFDGEARGGDFHKEFEHADGIIFHVDIRRGDCFAAFAAAARTRDYGRQQRHYVEVGAHTRAYKRARVNI